MLGGKVIKSTSLLKPVASLPDDKLITVDWLLDNVDLSFKGYIPSPVAIEFFNFIRLTLGEEPENSNPLAHYFLIDSIFMQDSVREYFTLRGINYDEYKGRTVVLCCREFAKSTLIGSFLPLYMAWKGELPGFGKVNYGLYVGDSMNNNVQTTMRTIESVYNESEWLQTQFESVRFTDAIIELVRHPRDPKELKAYKLAIDSGKKPHQVPGRSKRKFAMKGVGAQALNLDAILYTETGTTTIGECQVGDKIYGADGKLCTITKKSEIFHKPMYKLELKDGRSIKVSDNHINSIIKKTGRGLRKLNVTTKELLQMPLYFERPNGHKEQRLYIENCMPVNYPEQADIEVDTYTLGLILGDGTVKKNKNHVRLTASVDDMEFYKTQIPYNLGKLQIDSRNNNVVSVTISGIGEWFHENSLAVNSYDKFIPKNYLRGSIEQRLSLLQGLMDTDGTIAEGRRGARFMSTSKQLIEDVTELVRSLGGTVTHGKEDNSLHRIHTLYRIYIKLNMQLTRLPRKVKLLQYDLDTKVGIKSITPIKLEPSQCIAVDNEEHQFITDNYFRTHNTGTRGTRSGLQRPQFAIMDDLVSSESDASSDTVMKNINTTIDSDVLNALHGAGNFAILIGTPYNKTDPVYSRAESKGWIPVVFPICERIHEDIEVTEFQSVWENRHSFTAIMKRFKQSLNDNSMRSFMQELMLRITSDKDKAVNTDWIVPFKLEDVLKKGYQYNWCITTDFTTSGGHNSDFSGIAVWAISSNHDFLLCDIVLKKQDIALQYNDLFKLVEKYNKFTGSMRVGVEIDGQQKVHLFALKQLMNRRNSYFTMANQKGKSTEGILSRSAKGSKEDRFASMIPIFQQGKIWFAEHLYSSPDFKELLNEINYVTFDSTGRITFNSKHDDGLDLISMLGTMETNAPSPVITNNSIEYDPIWNDIKPDTTSKLDSYIV